MAEQFTKTFEITKVDKDERLVFGIFSMMQKNGQPLIDLDGEVITSSDLEKAVYQYNLYARDAGENHRKIGVGRLVESFVVTKAKIDDLKDVLTKMGVEGVSLEFNSEFWFGGFYIHDDNTWDLIKSGEYAMFSIGGFADKVSE